MATYFYATALYYALVAPVNHESHEHLTYSSGGAVNDAAHRSFGRDCSAVELLLQFNAVALLLQCCYSATALLLLCYCAPRKPSLFVDYRLCVP